MARWREFGDLAGEVTGGLQGLSFGRHARRDAPFHGFLAFHCPPGDHHIKSAALTNQAWQPHRGAIAHRHAKAPAEHAEDTIFIDDSDIAPQGDPKTAGDRMTLDRRDDRFGKDRVCRAFNIAGPCQIDARFALRKGLQIRAGADGHPTAAFAVENERRQARRAINLMRSKGVHDYSRHEAMMVG